MISLKYWHFKMFTIFNENFKLCEIFPQDISNLKSVSWYLNKESKDYFRALLIKRVFFTMKYATYTVWGFLKIKSVSQIAINIYRVPSYIQTEVVSQKNSVLRITMYPLPHFGFGPDLFNLFFCSFPKKCLITKFCLESFIIKHPPGREQKLYFSSTIGFLSNLWDIVVGHILWGQ